MRRKDREVTDRTVIDEIIRSCDCIRLGLNDSGEVYIVPMNFGYEHAGEKRVFYMHCAKEGRKLDIIRENPKIGFELDCGYKTLLTEEACECTAGYRSVIGTGHIEILTETKDKVTGLDSLMKQVTGRMGYSYTEAQLNAVCVMKLTVEKLSCKQHLI